MVHSSCRSICHSPEPQSSTQSYVSPVQDQNAWDIDTLNMNWSGLTAYSYPPTALLHRVIQKVRQSNCLIIVIAPGWPGTQCSSQQRSHFNFQCQELFSNSPTIMCSTASQPPRLVSRSGQLQEQGFFVEVAENCCPSEIVNKDHLPVKVSPI